MLRGAVGPTTVVVAARPVAAVAQQEARLGQHGHLGAAAEGGATLDPPGV